jgi:prepilin-type N-terminal cleavage/methylation domain-containing protein
MNKEKRKYQLWNLAKRTDPVAVNGANFVGGSAGFTLLEALAALAVLSIAGMSVLAGANIAINTLDAAKTRAVFTARLLYADERLRRTVGEIAIPYWEQAGYATAKLVMSTHGNTLELPWYQGKRDAVLRLYQRDTALVLDIVTTEGCESIPLYEGVESVELGLMLNAGEQPCGVTVKLRMNSALAGAKASAETRLPAVNSSPFSGAPTRFPAEYHCLAVFATQPQGGRL